jgi:DNA-binding NarL/FixJ family response regulator
MCYLISRTDVERSQQRDHLISAMDWLASGTEGVESAINAWNLLASGLKAIGRNRQASNPLSPIEAHPLSTRPASSVSTLVPQKPKHVNPPIPLFTIPRSEWPQVVRRVAQGESLRQIARSYHTSHEAVRWVLSAVQKELVAVQGVEILVLNLVTLLLYAHLATKLIKTVRDTDAIG